MTQMHISEKQTHMRTDCGCYGRESKGEKDWEFGISTCKLFYIDTQDPTV